MERFYLNVRKVLRLFRFKNETVNGLHMDFKERFFTCKSVFKKNLGNVSFLFIHYTSYYGI